MSKKYRFKIDTPQGLKGDIIAVPIREGLNYFNLRCELHICHSPEAYPDIFEEVIEKNSIEIVVSWLRGSNVMTYSEIAQKLLSAGLDPEKLK